MLRPILNPGLSHSKALTINTLFKEEWVRALSYGEGEETAWEASFSQVIFSFSICPNPVLRGELEKKNLQAM